MTNTHMSISTYDVNVTAKWADHIDKVTLDIRGPASSIHWQQSVEDAIALRDQLTAAIDAAQLVKRTNGGAQ